MEWLKIISMILGPIGAGTGSYALLYPPQAGPSPAPVKPAVSIPASLELDAGGHSYVKADTQLKKIKWVCDSDSVTVVAEKFEDKTECLVIASEPGEYKLMALAAQGSNPVHSDWCVITVTGAQPPPEPQPQPEPKPAPEPPKPDPPQPDPTPKKPAHLQVVVIDDAMTRDPALTAFLMDPYWGKLRTVGHDIRMVNSSRQDYLDHYAKEIQSNGGLPTIIVKSGIDEKVMNAGDMRLPADTASLRGYLKKYTDNLP